MNAWTRYRALLVPCLLAAWGGSAAPAHAESCAVALGQAQLDFGQIGNPGNRHGLEREGYAIGTRYASFNARCPSLARMVLMIRGDSGGEQFRFARQGQLRVRLSHAVLDGRAVDLAVVQSVGETPGPPMPALDVAPEDLIVPVSAGLAAEGSLLSLQIEVSPSVTLDEFSARDSMRMEAHLSLEVREY